MSERKLFTSESVSEGHPDKIADQISDAILDAILAQDPEAHVAAETAVYTGSVHVFGEISTTAYVRPYELTLSRNAENALAKGEISHIHNIGFLTRVELQSLQSQHPIEVLLTKDQFLRGNYQLGETVYLTPDNLNLFQNMNL